MELILYKTLDSGNVINKTLEYPLVFNVRLRSEVDITSPSLILRSSDLNSGYNYCHFVDMDRFYFIKEMKSKGGSVWELNCECDYLETYKMDILVSNCRFRRGIRQGDYFSGEVDESVIKTIDKFEGTVSVTGETSMILTSVGEV